MISHKRTFMLDHFGWFVVRHLGSQVPGNLWIPGWLKPQPRLVNCRPPPKLARARLSGSSQKRPRLRSPLLLLRSKSNINEPSQAPLVAFWDSGVQNRSLTRDFRCTKDSTHWTVAVPVQPTLEGICTFVAKPRSREGIGNEPAATKKLRAWFPLHGSFVSRMIPVVRPCF